MIAVCLKWVDLQPEVSSVVARVAPDVRFAGVSASDQAALEWALRCRDATGDDVLAVTAGPAAAESILRDALASRGSLPLTKLHSSGPCGVAT